MWEKQGNILYDRNGVGKLFETFTHVSLPV